MYNKISLVKKRVYLRDPSKQKIYKFTNFTNSIINDITEILEIKNNIQIMDSYRLGKFNEKETNIRPLKMVSNKTID